MTTDIEDHAEVEVLYIKTKKLHIEARTTYQAAIDSIGVLSSNETKRLSDQADALFDKAKEAETVFIKAVNNLNAH